MPQVSELAVLAPRVVQDANLPRRWRKRGRFADLSPLDETELLAHAFQIQTDALPAAPLHYLGVTGIEPRGYCLYAYPVHLHARREQLVLMAGTEFEPDERESQSLIETLRAHFPEWRIERTDDAMWFITVPGVPDLDTTPLSKVLGEDINDHLPQGGDAMAWHSIMNELQMLLFDTQVNRDREESGQPPINSLWFWGGGRLPEIPSTRWKRIVTDNPVALGLGRLAGIETCWLESIDSVPDATDCDTLWVHSGRQHHGIDDDRWGRIRSALRQGELSRLTLIEPGYGSLIIDARDTRSWLPW